MPNLPGNEIINKGFSDLRSKTVSPESLLILSARIKLTRLGFNIPFSNTTEPSLKMFALLEEKHGNAAHSKYNALRRQLVSFMRAVQVRKNNMA